jgi:hypothetical protein
MTTDAQEAAAQVERLLDRLRALPDPRAAEAGEELVRCLVQLYGEGLSRIALAAGPQALTALAEDPLVESLLLVHDLHPLDAPARIRRALPTVESVTVDASGVAHVRLPKAGCGSDVEGAVRAAAPEVTGVEVEYLAPLLRIGRRAS